MKLSTKELSKYRPSFLISLGCIDLKRLIDSLNTESTISAFSPAFNSINASFHLKVAVAMDDLLTHKHFHAD